jgi:hypothetical protein
MSGVGTRRRRPQRGAALILVMMLVAVFLILMGSLIDALALESQSSIESADSAAAVTAAYSGVDLMILSIEEFYDNGIKGGQPPPAISCNFGQPSGGSVTTNCYATIDKAWNGSGINYYLIRSTGKAIPAPNQEVNRQVLALIKQVPFGAYAHFSESEHSNTGGPIWYSSRQSFNGPVYSGGDMHIMYDSSSSTPIFPMGFTTDQPQGNMHWIDVADGNHSQPNTQQELYSVYGTSGPTFAPSGINLPGFAQNLDVFSEAYFGNDQHGTTGDLQTAGQTPGVFVNGGDASCPSGVLCSGIFVSGTNVTVDASSTASPNGDLSSGTQSWTFKSLDFADTTVTVDFGANTTTVTVGGNTKTYSGVASGEPSDSSQGNGAIFVDGSLEVTDGSTVHGQYTVAVPDPPIKAEGIQLDGSVTDASDPTKGPSQDELALWADTVSLKSGDANPIIEAMVLTGYSNECTNNSCGGWFGNYYCKFRNACTGGGMGTLTVYGSDIENLRGKMGIVDGSGSPVAGYVRNQTYDPRLGANPPPFSPTTNLYSIVALQDVGALQVTGFPGH